MKAIAILPAAAAAIMALSVSLASSQEVCLKEYQACMDSCGSKPGPQMQDSCFTNCQTRNNMCSERVFGGGAPGAAIVNVPQAPAKDAMAKKAPKGRDAKRSQKQGKEVAKTPAAESQQEQAPAAEQEQAPAR
jgi:hypothetical protein